MISKVTLSELWKVTMRRSTLITIPKLNEFFEFNNEFSGMQVFYQIVRDALDKFQLYYPLYRVQKTYVEVDSVTHKARVYDNFEGYLKGVITEDQLFLLPGSVIGLSNVSMIGTSYPLRDFTYDTGQFDNFWYTSGQWWMACLCYRPFPELFEENGNPTDNCAVWFMNKDLDPQYKYFKDQVYVELCRYIYNMMNNMRLSNLPIEVFAGLQEDSQRVQSDLDKVYEQAVTGSLWLI